MGKVKKWRECPALGKNIRPAECGETRNTKVSCPISCAFNPLSPDNFDEFRKLDKKFNRWLFEKLRDHPQHGPAVEAEIRKLPKDAEMEDVDWIFMKKLFMETDEAGLTLAQKWQSDPEAQENDYAIMLRVASTLKISLFEVRRVLGKEAVEVVDLLSEEPRIMLALDEPFASQACRFQVLVGWIYETPHFWRPCAQLSQLPVVEGMEPLEICKTLVQHLGGPEESSAWTPWFRVNYLRFLESATAVERARMTAALRTMDFQDCLAEYALNDSMEACLAKLDTSPHVKPEGLDEKQKKEGFLQARVWFEDLNDSDLDFPEGPPVLGKILIHEKAWVLQAMGHGRFLELQGEFEELMGDKVSFAFERREDLAKQAFADEENDDDDSLVPPKLMEHVKSLTVTMSMANDPSGMVPEHLEDWVGRRYDEQWLDLSIPALKDMTPREAAQDKATRPTLIRLMKSRISEVDARNLETGSQWDINWMVEELGLDEILLPPPPGRTPKATSPTHIPPRTPYYLPPQKEPLSEKLISRSISNLLGEDQFMQGLGPGQCRVLNSFFDLQEEGLIGEEEWQSIFGPVGIVLCLLISPTEECPGWHHEDFSDLIHAELRNLEINGFPARSVPQFLSDSPEPHLLKEVAELFLDPFDLESEEDGENSPFCFVGIIILKVLIAHLARLRRQA